MDESEMTTIPLNRLLEKVELAATDESQTPHFINEPKKRNSNQRKLIGSPKTFFENQNGDILVLYKAALFHQVGNIRYY
jgi:hypothetical protein